MFTEDNVVNSKVKSKNDTHNPKLQVNQYISQSSPEKQNTR